ncbi:hypothetical protein ACIBF1_23455 [Spirillospora sp. NPDC050679]
MNDLKDKLDGLADAPRPGPSRVDVAAAVAKGRRTRRLRRAATGTGLAAAVALGAVVVVDLPGGDPERPAVSSSTASGVAYPNPIMQPATFGWLPKGYQLTQVTADRQNGATVEFGVSAPGRVFGISLMVHGPGQEPPIAKLPGGKPGRRTPAPSVNGRPAFWTIEPGGPGSDQVPAEFRWQYAPGRWAELTVNDVHLASADTVYRLAKNVKFGPGRPMAFPVTIKGLPPGLRMYSTTRNLVPMREMTGPTGKRHDPIVTFGMTTAARGSDPDSDLSIVVTRHDPAAPKEAGVNTEINGHPAYDSALGAPTNQPKRSYKKPGATSDRRNGQILRVYGMKGHDIEISAYGEPWKKLRASGGLTGLYKRITLLGDDPADWTTDPLVR